MRIIFNRILLLLLILCLIVPFASATNISFIKQVPYLNDYNVQVWSGSTMVGVYNTSSQNIPLLDNGTYNFVLYYPQDETIGEPDTFAFGLLDKIQGNKYGMVIGAMVVGILLFGVFLGNKR